MKNKSLIALLVGFSIPTIVMPIMSSLVELAEGQIEIAKGGQVRRITEINIENTCRCMFILFARLFFYY